MLRKGRAAHLTRPLQLTSTCVVGDSESQPGTSGLAGIFISKPFVDYPPEAVRARSGAHLDGFIYLRPRVSRQLLAPKSGGIHYQHDGVAAELPLN